MTWAKELMKKIPTFTRNGFKSILIGLAILLLFLFRDCNIKTKDFQFESKSKIPTLKEKSNVQQNK